MSFSFYPLKFQYIQKKHPLYEQVKEETVWSLEQLQEYVNKTSNDALPHDWVFTTFTVRMGATVCYISAIRPNLNYISSQCQ